MSRKKGKSKAKAGSAKSTPHRAPAKRHSSQSWPVHEATAPKPKPKFSLVDEAHWMSQNRSAAFEAGKKLRHMPIHFISAGRLEGTIQQRLPDAELAESESSAESLEPSSPSSSAPDNTNAMAHMAIRSPSPAPSEASSSSADEVVFTGRGPPSVAPVATLNTSTPSQAATVRSLQHATKTASQLCAPSETITATPQLTVASTADHTSVTEEGQASVELSIRLKETSRTGQDADSDGGSDGVVQTQFAKRRAGKPAWEGTTTPWQHRSKPGVGWTPTQGRFDMDAHKRGEANPRDAAMDDYMQNTEEFGLSDNMMAASGFARCEMDLDGGSHNDWESAPGSQEDGNDGEGSDDWDSDMMQIFDDISTSSDVMHTIVRILSKRTRKSGLHYLCVYEGSLIDDARWLPSTFLKSPDEKLLVRAFEAEAYERKQQQLTSSNSEDDSDSDDSEEEFDDETIARVLQKQEELGLGSDEMLLYAGDDIFDGASATKKSSFGGYGRPSKKRQARVRGNRDPSFPSASALADAIDMDPYRGFDIMDTERPSLRPIKKGRRGQMPPELDDSDLNEQRQNMWEADRAKKRLKKAEREELRQQGLLGRKGKAPNLKVKYQGGIAMEDVVEELREFLMGDMQTLSLPPMDAHRRATIHQAATFFNLTSRSRGDGLSRFTVLSKTLRTRTFTDDEFDIAIQKKGFQKRLRGPLNSEVGPRPGKFATVKHSGARTRPQLGYKDGETVGADAPELGPENKGHALMMKMGWSKGMGLGACDNKGILQPIPHTVKTNKAGLQ
ncbi:hypothetical protein EJ02DRAFT_234026 [Clathrospora elynae]|uniref:Protein SQS1 n=1 Tax=Clathrospora elynae TaxID=706981 RepID=A0A6A5T3L3_9PLEO|nr:hypothetical protein EJ02DRAFT_234026 [Clathrospora elynae]